MHYRVSTRAKHRSKRSSWQRCPRRSATEQKEGAARRAREVVCAKGADVEAQSKVRQLVASRSP